VIRVPAITIGSDFDGAAADGRAYAAKFAGDYSHRVLDGIGHNVPQEAPAAFADAVLEISRASEETRPSGSNLKPSVPSTDAQRSPVRGCHNDSPPPPSRAVAINVRMPIGCPNPLHSR
jgi:hypothetical protein